MQLTTGLKGNRKYKDRLFRLLFSEKEQLLELYNALNGSYYQNADDLEITTLDDVLYMKMKNDVSILLDDYLSLYEHQSTWNQNLPFRGLLYFAELFRQITKDKNIYGSKLIKLPTPIYIVFYNGNRNMGEEKILKLSDAFSHGNAQSKMELEVKVLNINYGHNQKLMEQCKMLREYSIFVDKIKRYSKEIGLEPAIDKAIKECIKENVLKDFLKRRRSEVICSILTEYDEEKVLAQIGQEHYEDGVEQGIAQGEQRFASLTEKLLEQKKYDDLSKATKDKIFREELYQKLGL